MIDEKKEFEIKELDITVNGGTFHVRSFFDTTSVKKSINEVMTSLIELIA